MTDIDRPTPGTAPTEGRNDLPLPGAGTPSDAIDTPIPGPAGPLRDIGDQPEDRETQRRDELADRVGVGMPTPAGSVRPDVLPDVDPPDRPM